jgi:hypothetical protein
MARYAIAGIVIGLADCCYGLPHGHELLLKEDGRVGRVQHKGHRLVAGVAVLEGAARVACARWCVGQQSAITRATPLHIVMSKKQGDLTATATSSTTHFLAQWRYETTATQALATQYLITLTCDQREGL